MKKFMVIMLALVMSMSFLAGCSKDTKNKDKVVEKSEEENKEDITQVDEKEDSEPAEEETNKSDMVDDGTILSRNPDKITPGDLDDEIGYEAAIILAESNNIELSREAVEAYYNSKMYSSSTTPTTKGDLKYSAQALEAVCGRKNILRRIAPQYVMDQMRARKEEVIDNMSDEEIEEIVYRYDKYMDSMGIAESAKREYAVSLYKGSELEMQVSDAYDMAYAKATYIVFSKYAPEYMSTLSISE